MFANVNPSINTGCRNGRRARAMETNPTLFEGRTGDAFDVEKEHGNREPAKLRRKHCQLRLKWFSHRQEEEGEHT